MQEFENKVVVITGGAAGIGFAMAKRFAAEGARLVLADINEDGVRQAADDLAAETGAEVLAVVTDVSKAESVQDLARATLDRFGAVDVLINNAGIGVSDSTWDTSIADWEFTLGVNVWGVIHGVRTFVPIMRERGEEAYVVNTASLAGLGTVPTLGAYCASKHAVVGLTEALHLELRVLESPVRAAVLCPSFVNTAIFSNSEKMRPSAGSDLEGNLALYDEFMKRGIGGGVEPGEIADLVLDGLRKNRFWLVPVAEDFAQSQTRVDEIVEGRNPEPGPIDELLAQLPELERPE